MNAISKTVMRHTGEVEFAEAKLSPLDQIRHIEADITRQIAVAREAAEKTVAHERTQAARLKKEAQEAGHREGQSRYKELIAEAQGETRVLVAQAHQRAEELRQRGQRQLSRGIHDAVRIILGEIDNHKDAERSNKR